MKKKRIKRLKLNFKRNKNNEKTKVLNKINKNNLDKKKTTTSKNEVKIYRSPKEIKTNRIMNISLAVILLITVIVGYYLFGSVCALALVGGMILILAIHLLLQSKRMSRRKRKVINAIFILFLTLGIIGLVSLSAFLAYITIKAPQFDPNNLDMQELSIVYDANGEIIAKLGAEKREKVTYDELPQVLIDAIVATEDSRFYQHNGFDAPRFAVATVKQLIGSSSAGGASTLSMQVVKNSFTDASLDSGLQGIIRKFTDIYLSVFKLEKNYSKEEIIEFYVNNHYLGGNIYGVEEASQAYFNKSVGDLNLSEASIIAGMFKNPGRYSPTIHPENAAVRRSVVLRAMKRNGYITEEEEKLANSIPVETLTKSIDEGSGNSTNAYQGYIDTVVKELDEKYNVNPYKTSLLIYTNMDRGKQDGINRVFNGETYTWVDDKIQSGVTVLDSQTGKILAIGAGRNRSIGGWNFAVDNKRQPGSTAKPLFDYGPGIEYNDWSTYQQFIDEPYTYTGGRKISNWDNSYMGRMTLRQALAKSRNIPALKAFQQVDKKKIIEFVTTLGIEPEIENGYIHEAHSIGAFTGVNTVQMSAAYAAFSNGGYYNEPYTVSKITYRQSGTTIEHKSEKKRAMSDSTAFMIASVLQDVVLNGGGKISNYAVKTGTTNFDDATVQARGLPWDAIRDSWAVGFSTKTTLAMWYGYNESNSEYCMRNVPASVEKDKLYRKLVEAAVESDREEFRMPDSVVKLPIINGSDPAKVAPSGYTGGNVIYEYFKKSAQPSNSGGDAETKLSAPKGLKASVSNGTVTLTWNASENLYSEYGTFGYNVYLGNTLLGFTESTSFSKQLSNPYGTYKVVATYQSYSGVNSNVATVTVEEKKVDIKYSIKYYCGSELLSTTNKSATGSDDGYYIKESDIDDLAEATITAKGCTKQRTLSNNVPGSIKNGATITVTYEKKDAAENN